MATTYNADRMAAGVQPIQNATGETSVVSIYTISAALVINDLVRMVTLPAGAYVLNVRLATDALDTNAGSNLAYDVGDSNSATRYISNKAQGNNTKLAPYSMDQKDGLGYKIGTNTGDNIIIVKVHTAPATAATTGQIVLVVTYSMEARTASA